MYIVGILSKKICSSPTQSKASTLGPNLFEISGDLMYFILFVFGFLVLGFYDMELLRLTFAFFGIF